MRPLRKIVLLTLSVAWTALADSVASAQEVEPNDTCATAKPAGTVAGPAIISGSLVAATAPPSDVDFLRFTAPPGLTLRVFPTSPSRLGVFNEACQLLVASPFLDFGRVDFRVPASGVFILAVAEFDDELFTRASFSSSGPYQLLFDVTIGSISGRLVNAVSGAPVGGGPGFPQVQIRRCVDGFCGDIPTVVPVGADGRFRIERDFDGFPLPAGEFEVRALVDQFELATRRFNVAGGQNLDLGDVSLTPFALSVTNVRPCMDLPPEGGTCRYTVTITNGTAARLNGQALSLVNGGFDATVFEASTLPIGSVPVRAQLSLASRSGRDVTFFFDVPSLVPSGTMICTFLQVGVHPSPLFNGARRMNLFCITKGAAGFEVMSTEQSRAVFDRMRGTDALPPQPMK